jgi:hypothetical protein
MPDFERLTDDLAVHMAKKNGVSAGHSQEYWEGRIKGKTIARIQVAVIFGIAVAIYSLCIV